MMATTVIRVLILGQGDLVNRLPEVIAAPGIEITYAGNKTSPLARSQFVDTFVELNQVPVDGPNFEISKELENFLAVAIFDLVAISEDTIAVGIRQSKLPLEKKLRSLPIHSERGLKLIGSKVGFVEIAKTLGLSIPHSVIVTNTQDLSNLPIQIKTGDIFVYKGDFSGGGSQVQVVSTTKDKLTSPPESWYPLVLQEFVEGITVNVDAFF